MKIAQALNKRKSINDELNNLLAAVGNNAYSAPGTEPDENPNNLLAKYHSLRSDLEGLIRKINSANNSTIIKYEDFEGSLTDARLRRDMLIESSQKLRNLPTQKVKAYGSSTSELRIDGVQTRRVADDFARRAREIDDLIQQTNWAVDV